MTKRPRPPLSPEAAEVVKALQGGRLTRRSVLGAVGAVGLGAAVTGCGTSGSEGGAAASSGSAGAVQLTPAEDRSAAEKVVNWANWTLYLDYDDDTKKYPTLEKFKAETGIDYTYAEDIEDNETFYGKVQAQMRQGQDIGKDIITMTDYMASRLVKAGWVQKLDQSKIPNGQKILANFKGNNNAWDPNRDYSYTWQAGYAGLGWNTPELEKLTGKTELKSIDELWDPQLKGRVEVLSEMRDTIGLILLSQGIDITTPPSSEQWQAALDVLDEQLSNGQIRQVKGNSYKEDLISKDAVAVIGWSGDMFQLDYEDGSKGTFGFGLPESGGTLWSDNLMIPMGSPHKTNAETLINFYYEPEIAAEVAAWVNYICPVQGAKEAMAAMPDVDQTVLNSPYVFPADADLAKVHQFAALDDATTKEFTEAFQKVLGV